MPSIPYPVASCSCATPDLDSEELLATLLSIHATDHKTSSAPVAAAKTEKVKRPTVSIGGTSEEWSYFMSRWQDYKTATRIDGTDVVIQLLECCDETLRKDLT